MPIDFAGINAGLLARAREFLLEIFPSGTIEGHEFKIGDIDGTPGRSMSINMRTGVGSDFASGESWSDLIAVYAAHRRIPMGEAAKELGGDRYKSNGTHARPVPTETVPDKPSKNAIIPVPANAPAPPTALRVKRKGEWIERPIVAKWAYHTADGGLIGYACRIEFDPDPETGEITKDVIPVIYAHDAKQKRDRWMQGAFPKPRPLYGLPAVVDNDGANILLVEGEKCVDYARALGIKRIATTWPGGGRAVKHADFSPIAGRDVLLFPDHDEPGRDTMAEAAERLLMLKCHVSIIDTQADDLPDGWDIADSGFDKKQFNEWARSRIRPIGQAKTAPPPEARRGAPRSDPDETPVVSSGGIVLSGGENAFVNWSALALDLDTKQQPYPNTANLIAILSRHPKLKGRIWYDEFYNRIYHTLLTDTPQEMADHIDVELTAWMQSAMKMPKVTKGCVRDAVTSVAMRDTRNAPREWVQSLTWDETERLPMMFCDGWGVAANSYTTSISRCFMVGMIARLMEPGCQVDYLPVFESTEGKNKSKALRALGGIWHTEMHEEIGGKDFYQGLTGKLIVEFSEMHSIAGKDVRRIKGILTNPVDRYRESYGHRPADHRRRCVFVATTNPEDWNESDTGARRFWPLACGDVNVDYILANREQLFAEALARYRRSPPGSTPERRSMDGSAWWDFDMEAAGEEQEARRVSDPWTENVLGFAQFATRLTVEAVLEDGLRLPIEQRNMLAARRVGRILRSSGYVKKVIREGRKLFKAWVLP